MLSHVPSAGNPRNLPMVVHGLYFLLAGAWPLVHYRSFELVTGRKTDAWLVRTVGTLITIIGGVVTYSAILGRVRLETFMLGYGSALGLTAIEVYYAGRRRISLIYLADALAEIAFVGLIERQRRKHSSAAARGKST